MLSLLIDLIAEIWRGDKEIRDSSMVGESDLDKRSRRAVGLICGTLITLLMILGLALWYFLS